jgi:TonB family protein
MLAEILALALAAAPAAQAPPGDTAQPPGKTVSPIIVSPEAKPPPADITLNMQGSEDDIDQLVVIWPGTAYETRLDGRVTLRCNIDIHGLAEKCEVAYEAPEGKGFGKAALEMRPTIKVAPAQGPDGPIATVKTIAIRFKAPDTRFDLARMDKMFKTNDKVDLTELTFGADIPLAMRPVTMLDFPIWAQAANFDDLASAYPARGGGVEGYAVAHCQVKRTGALDGCQVIKEDPVGRDFGKAALNLAASKFKVAPQLAAARQRTPLWVDVAIRLPPPAQLADRTVMAPAWLVGLDPKTTPKLFPPEAAASGLTTGRGVARCTVGPDGAMTACVPEPGDPDGLGFSEAAAKIAAGLKMNLWSADGAPVEGGVIHIPVRLNLKGG